MAVKTSVPIVPITISHAHAVMPGFSLFPVQPGRGKIHVHIHDPIEANGKSEEELSEMVRKVFLSSLPYDQHPKEKELPATLTEEVVLATEAAMVIEHPQSHDAHHEAKVHVESPFFFADKIQVKQGEKELETVR